MPVFLPITIVSRLRAQTEPKLTAMNHVALPSAKKDFYFIALGDNRSAGPNLGPNPQFLRILKEVSIINPSFVISSGDLLYGYGDTLAQYKVEIEKAKAAIDTVPCPFINVPGNHEMAGNVKFAALYKANIGALYGSFNFGQWRFVGVNTDVPPTHAELGAAQLTWLTSLMRHPQPTVVFEHRPIYKRPSNTETDGATVSDADKINSLYLDGGVQAVFEGHDHVNNVQTHDGVVYAIAGNDGAPLDAAPTDGGYYGYTIVHVKGKSITLTPVPVFALNVRQIAPGEAAVEGYCDASFPITNVRVYCSHRPTKVSAIENAKGVLKPYKVELIRVIRSGKGYIAQVGMKLPKHHAVRVSVK